MRSGVEHVILVNDRDERVGTAEKLEAHELGLLHRAFSVFLVDDKRRILLQRRSELKYHSGGLWANSCCGHPRPNESTLRAAHRRLFEELGTRSALGLGFKARYRASVSDTLVENEIVHVFFGRYSGHCDLNPAEVSDTQWCALPALMSELGFRRDLACWLKHYMNDHAEAVATCVEGVARARPSSAWRHGAEAP
jgi:isopentenyl-diphosphate delta-isomerase